MVLQKTYFIITAALLVCFLGLSAPVADAQTVQSEQVNTTKNLVDLQSVIKKLLEQIQSLQKQVLELQNKNSAKVAEEGEQKVTLQDVEVLENIKVRSDAGVGAGQIAIKQRGMKGEIVAGPVVRGGMKWYKIKYTDGTVGWSAAPWLKISERVNQAKKDDEKKDNADKYQYMCSADAFQCPDGSWVGRSGPSCKFRCRDTSVTPPVGVIPPQVVPPVGVVPPSVVPPIGTVPPTDDSPDVVAPIGIVPPTDDSPDVVAPIGIIPPVDDGVEAQ